MHVKLRTITHTDGAVNNDRYGDNRGWGDSKHNGQYYDFKLGPLRTSTIKPGGARLRRGILSRAKII